MDLEQALRQKDEEMVRIMNDQNESRNVLLQNKDYIIQQLQVMHDQNVAIESEYYRRKLNGDSVQDKQNEILTHNKFGCPISYVTLLQHWIIIRIGWSPSVLWLVIVKIIPSFVVHLLLLYYDFSLLSPFLFVRSLSCFPFHPAVYVRT